ncbi:MAG: dihydrofolate reductase [Clostridia bacterium]|nr:dihydrofolate reductase [Clostridia bacterium]
MNHYHLSAIVAVDASWGIGNEGNLLCRVSDDLKNFRAYTTGKTVILGSKTLATFPGGRPLKNRRNIVLSRRPDFAPEGAEVSRSVEEALALLTENEEAVVIGGETVYRQFLPYCDTAVVSKFDIDLPDDAVFPNLDTDPAWAIAEEGETRIAAEGDSHPGMKWRIVTYKRRG